MERGRIFLLVKRAPRLDLLEEIIALVVYKDKGGEILNFDLPYSFHAKLGIFEQLDIPDGVLGKNCSGTPDGAEIESSMFHACVGNLLAAVSLRDHHH